MVGIECVNVSIRTVCALLLSNRRVYLFGEEENSNDSLCMVCVCQCVPRRMYSIFFLFRRFFFLSRFYVQNFRLWSLEHHTQTNVKLICHIFSPLSSYIFFLGETFLYLVIWLSFSAFLLLVNFTLSLFFSHTYINTHSRPSAIC